MFSNQYDVWTFLVQDINNEVVQTSTGFRFGFVGGALFDKTANLASAESFQNFSDFTRVTAPQQFLLTIDQILAANPNYFYNPQGDLLGVGIYSIACQDFQYFGGPLDAVPTSVNIDPTWITIV